jgi:hypothetical protein
VRRQCERGKTEQEHLGAKVDWEEAALEGGEGGTGEDAVGQVVQEEGLVELGT